MVHSYATLVDDGDIDAVVALFEHATWRSDHNDTVRRGAAGVRPVYEQLAASRDAARTRHLLADVAVTVDPGAVTASSRCTWTVLRDGTDGSTDVVLSGQYVDRFAKVSGRWCFADRLITTGPPGG
jgi:3-phenylpropionate/cinnamic acid dioxygenase small subunit